MVVSYMVQLEDTTYHQLTHANKEQAEQILLLKAEVSWLREQLRLSKKRLFAPSSEQTPPGQEALLFNEAEASASGEIPEPATECITYTRRKKKGKREADLSGLPIEELFYRLPLEEQVCPQCQGALHEMGEDVRQEIKVIPASFTLVRHIRAKYACRHCQKEELTTPILTAPMPAAAFPNSLASPSAVASIMSGKFVEGLPLYRQQQSFSRLGFQISRQTMANWMITGASWLEKLYQRMRAHLLKKDILHADETTVQVLKEAGRAAQTNSYMWLYRTGRDGPPILLFEYQRTRDGAHAKRFLSGFSGYLHVDGYVGYEGMPGVTLSGCWAHARRKFVDAIKILPEDIRLRGGTTAHAGLKFINDLFAIERDLADCAPDERLLGREERSRKVVDEFEVWLTEHKDKVLPKSPLGTAIGYCRNQWNKLSVFLTDGRLEIDNNRSERAIKPFVIGRKNWLFANTPKGARSSAVIYSIVETAKENGLNPLSYLSFLFEQLPNIDLTDEAALDLLLPWSETVQNQFRTSARTDR